MSTTVRKYPARRPPHSPGALTLLAVVLAATVVPVLGQDPANAAARDGQANGDLPPLTERQARQLQVLSIVVLNPSDTIDADTRRTAAEELIAMQVPQATGVLAKALVDEQPVVVRAVVSAMISCVEPPSGLLPPAVETLRRAQHQAGDDLAKAIARYGDDGLALVVDAAMDGESATPERLGPIKALSSFRSRLAPEKMVELLDPARDEPEEIVAAACEALRLYTNLPNGDPASWRRWWSEARNQTQEEWLKTRVDRLTQQLGETEADLAQQRALNDRMEQRLHAAYRELFPSLSYDNQLRTMPKLLDEELDAVRRFAVEQLDRLLRDTVAIPLPVQDKLAERLDDRLPEVRIRAAHLLDELAYERVSERVAARLATEPETAVRAAMLQVLAKRPSTAALEPVRAALTDAELGEQAAAALWGLAKAVPLSAEQIEPTRAAVRSALEAGSGTPAMRHHLTGVLAVIGGDQDIANLVVALDGDDAAVQRFVAEGFAIRGLSAPLTARADDERIYPFAVQALAAPPPNLADVQTLLRLIPPDAHRQSWADALRRATSGLDPATILVIDDQLETSESATAELRRDLLERLTRLPADDVTAEERAAVSMRLAPLLYELGQPVRARELLQPLAETVSDEQKPQLFRAMLESGAFDLAAELESRPGAWVDVLESLASLREARAVVLRDEIARRFGDELGDDRERFEAASALLPAGNRSSSAGEPSAPDSVRAATADSDGG